MFTVRVQQRHGDFAAVARVDSSRGVNHRQAVFRGEAGPGVDQCHKPVRKGDGDAGGHQPPLARLQDHVLTGAQVGAGVAGVGVRRRFQAGVEHFQLNLHSWRSELCCGQAPPSGRRSVGCRVLQRRRNGCFFVSHSPSLYRPQLRIGPTGRRGLWQEAGRAGMK